MDWRIFTVPVAVPDYVHCDSMHWGLILTHKSTTLALNSRCQTEVKVTGYPAVVWSASRCSLLRMKWTKGATLSDHLEVSLLPSGSFCEKRLWLKDIADRLTAAEKITPEACIGKSGHLFCPIFRLVTVLCRIYTWSRFYESMLCT